MIRLAHPLYWPDGVPRTPRWQQSIRDFSHSAFSMQNNVSADNWIKIRLDSLAGQNLIISTNRALKKDGTLEPRHKQEGITDYAASAYFELDQKPFCIACDRFESVDCNLRAISRTLLAIRNLETIGTPTLKQQALAGFALPEQPQWLINTWKGD